MLSAAVCPCRSATTQCSTRMASPVRPVRPARDVAGREESRRARFEKGVDGDAAVNFRPAASARPRRGARRGRRQSDRPREPRRRLRLRACPRRRAQFRPSGGRRRAARESARTRRLRSRPRIFSIGCSSGATTWTSMLRVLKRGRDFETDEAAPSTTARRAVFARSMIARQSLSDRSTSTSDGSAPGMDGDKGSAPVARSRRSKGSSRRQRARLRARSSRLPRPSY